MGQEGESKLEKLEALINDALDDGCILSTNLEKSAEKCISISVAVTPASLYTYIMHKNIAQ